MSSNRFELDWRSCDWCWAKLDARLDVMSWLEICQFSSRASCGIWELRIQEDGGTKMLVRQAWESYKLAMAV